MSESIEFKLPDVGEGIAEAELVEWLVSVGDDVVEDQPIVVIETDKSQLELPAPGAGVVTALHASEGDVVKVGGDLVDISTAGSRDVAGAGADASDAGSGVCTSVAVGGEPAAATAAAAVPVHRPSLQLSSSGEAATVTAPGASEASGRPGGMRPLASPSTRRLALQQGVDLAQVQGTGPNGRILATDLESAGAASAGAPAGADPVATHAAPRAGRRAAGPERAQDTTVIELRGLRRQIARSMTEALRIPHVTEFREIDATALLEARALLRPRFEEAGLRLSILPFLVKACTWALARHPSLNARFDAENERITQYRSVHLGIATATDDGLIVPVLRHSDELSMRAIAAEIDRLADLARTRKASPEELGDGTFTLTNFGSFGTWLGTPIIRPPEVAIAGFGRVEQKVIPVDGAPAVRPVLPIVVAADHRINDGAHLGGLVSDIAAALSQPLLLLDGI